MALPVATNYKQEYIRYRHYFGRIWQFYQKPSAKVSTALLLTIFTTVFFAVFAIRPTLITIAELLRTIEAKTETLGKLEAKSAALAQAQQEYAAASAQIDHLNRAIPPHYFSQTLITQVEATAAHHQLPLHSISLSETTYLPQAGRTDPDAVEIPLVVTLNADYPQLKAFLSDLVRLPRFLTVASVSFTPPQEGDTATQMQMSVHLKAHYLPYVAPGDSTPAQTF